MGAAAYAYKPQLGSSIDEQETDSRRKRRRRVKIAGSARRLIYCVVPLALILLYVGLMAGLTAQTYRLAAEQRLHSTLIERNNALRSQVAQLESVDRLESVARSLHMTEPNKVAFVSTKPPLQPAAHPFVLFARIVAVTRLFGVRLVQALRLEGGRARRQDEAAGAGTTRCPRSCHLLDALRHERVARRAALPGPDP